MVLIFLYYALSLSSNFSLSFSLSNHSSCLPVSLPTSLPLSFTHSVSLLLSISLFPPKCIPDHASTSERDFSSFGILSNGVPKIPNISNVFCHSITVKKLKDHSFIRICSKYTSIHTFTEFLNDCN